MAQANGHNRKLTDDDLLAVTDYIRRHIDKPIAIESLATVVGISASCFTRLFKQATGSTPHCYVVAQRIEAAKQLLAKDPRPSIASIASQTGFSDQAHLTRTFRRVTGRTPGSFAAPDPSADC